MVMSTTASSLIARGLGLVTAAGAAAGRVGGCLFAVLHLEGVATPARGGDVRVVDREPGREAVHPVDLSAGEIGRGVRIDDDGDAVRLDLAVAVLRATVEAERVLEAGAAAALDREAQHLGL